uniref:CMP/dCMP-type deaminase domain-containing protein n=1 Tax=viral metagenome TaxID=1070528 RepID=A0A6C0LJM4_9ZZZZ
MVDVRNAQRGADVSKIIRRNSCAPVSQSKSGFYTSNYFECIDSNCVRTSSEKQKYYLNIAAKIAIKSPMFNHKHGAIIVYRDKIIGSGFNYYVSDFSIHAEVAAIASIHKKKRHILNECDIYIVRIAPDRFKNMLKYSRPCANCSNIIIKNNIKNAFYSTNYEYDFVRGRNNCCDFLIS